MILDFQDFAMSDEEIDKILLDKMTKRFPEWGPQDDHFSPSSDGNDCFELISKLTLVLNRDNAMWCSNQFDCDIDGYRPSWGSTRHDNPMRAVCNAALEWFLRLEDRADKKRNFTFTQNT